MWAYVVFGFGVQFLLLAFFAAHRGRPSVEDRLGRLVYGMGLVAAMLAVVYVIAGQPWHLVMAFALYAVWCALGAWVDIVRPITWRQPPRWSVVLPYATLLIASLIALWVRCGGWTERCGSPSVCCTRPIPRSTSQRIDRRRPPAHWRRHIGCLDAP